MNYSAVVLVLGLATVASSQFVGYADYLSAPQGGVPQGMWLGDTGYAMGAAQEVAQPLAGVASGGLHQDPELLKLIDIVRHQLDEKI
ncbi:hypothetical protein FHG87_003237 [Trinorchestia longiramus]|nr:hypothetical protein FHG87_003237 [Trinorchestia longiramus]